MSIFEEVGAKISLWVFRSKRDVADAVVKLPSATYSALRSRLMQVRTGGGFCMVMLTVFQPQKRRNVIVERRIAHCSLDEILLVLRDEGVNVEQRIGLAKDTLLDIIDAQPPAVFNNILLRLHPARQSVIDRSFLTIPDEQGRQALVEQFIQSTSNEAVRQVVCCICAREVFKSEATSITLDEIPHCEVLCPCKPHPAHVLTSGMLLYRDPLSKAVPEFACTTCMQSLSSGKRPPLALSNNMWLGDVPFELRILTLCERILVSRFFSAAYIVKLYPKNRGARGWPKEMLTSAVKGNVSSYFLNTEDIVGMIDPGYLPPRPTILAATIGVTFIGRDNIPLRYLPPYLHVRRQRVREAISWLIPRNPLYKGQKISEVNLKMLPEDGVPTEVLDNMKWINDTRVIDRENGGYVPNHEGECDDSSGDNTAECADKDDVGELFRSDGGM